MGAGFKFKRKQRSEVFPGMDKITLHRDDLETILNMVDQLNPVKANDPTSGRVTITADNSSGIGSIVAVEIPTDIHGLVGTFKKVIADESEW